MAPVREGGAGGSCACGAVKASGHDLCTPCAWEAGWHEASVVSGASEAYGSFGGLVRERVEACGDYLGRVLRHLGGSEVSRHYVASKAQALRDAAGRLVATCHDVEGWLKSCGVPVRRSADGEEWFEECGLVAGHGGAHDVGPAGSDLQVARDRAEGLARVTVGLADALGWLDQSPGGLVDPEELAGLEREHRELRGRVERLSVALAALRRPAVGEDA